MFYTTAWCTDNEATFRRSIPLEILGESMRRHGSKIPFSIVMLEGMHRLSAGYIRTLEDLGFTLIDYQSAFERIIRDHAAIDKFYNRYARNCLLRWVAIRQLAAAASFKQCWHLDSDVVLHTSLDELAADTAGKTFMLQGCPVLVSIADPSWFQCYEENLKALNGDITGYSAHAWSQREECIRQDRRLANQSLYCNPFVHDQDLLEYLVSSEKIPQTPASSIFDSRYYFIQNGLALSHWHAAQYQPAGDGSSARPRFSMDENRHIYIGSKQVPFTHFQGNFSIWAGVYLTVDRLPFARELTKLVLAYDIHDEEFRTNVFFKVIAKINARRSSLSSRDSVIRQMLGGPNPPLLSLYDLLLKKETT